MATQLLGGALADRYGGKTVFAGGIAWFSIASFLLPVGLSPSVAAAGLALPAMLAARCFVVSGGRNMLTCTLFCGERGVNVLAARWVLSWVFCALGAEGRGLGGPDM